MRTVAVLVFDNVAVFEMAIACEVFGVDRSEMGVPRFRLLVCAAEPGPLRTSAGFNLDTPYGLTHLTQADMVVVPGWPDPGVTPPEPVLEALRAVHRRGARVISFCSGALVLASAGLLDGRRATTHWMHAERLAALHPKVLVDPSVLFVDDDPIFTSAGTSAGIDLCLHLLRLDHGAEVANVVARRMVVPPHRDGGQAQYVRMPIPQAPDGNRLSETLTWAVANLDRELTVECLASHCHVSTRTFARLFATATGTTPWQWLLAQRLVAAQRLLESTDLAVERVAEDCGFGSASNFRLHFGRRLGTSPAAYRRAFHRRPPPDRLFAT